MRTAVVTGAAKGIGRAVAARLVEDGVHVVAVDVDAVALESVSSELGGRFVPVVGDVGDWDTHERAADSARAAGSSTSRPSRVSPRSRATSSTTPPRPRS